MRYGKFKYPEAKEGERPAGAEVMQSSRQKITLNEPTKTKPSNMRLIQKRRNWCPVNQCECLLEDCYACEIQLGSELGIDNLIGKPQLMQIPNEKSTHKIWYCKHYKKEIKRVKL